MENFQKNQYVNVQTKQEIKNLEDEKVRQEEEKVRETFIQNDVNEEIHDTYGSRLSNYDSKDQKVKSKNLAKKESNNLNEGVANDIGKSQDEKTFLTNKESEQTF